jgi:hypothetical protein
MSWVATAEPRLPIQSGQYVFQHRFAEQPTTLSISLVAKIHGHHIQLFNETASQVFPKGVIAEGTLVWHVKTRQWIIAEVDADRRAKDVGGCSDGPEVVDLQQKIYWTC